MTERYGKEEKREERCQRGGDEGAGGEGEDGVQEGGREEHKCKRRKMREREVRNVCREEAAPASRCAAGASRVKENKFI